MAECTYFAYGLRHVGFKVTGASRRLAARSRACSANAKDRRIPSVLPRDCGPMF